MATIYNNIDRVANHPRQGISVGVSLVWDKSVSPVAKEIGEETMIQGPTGTTTDPEGFWSISDIVPNDDISPAGSVYRVREESPHEDDFIYYISVPTSATPTFWTGDLLVDAPSWAG